MNNIISYILAAVMLIFLTEGAFAGLIVDQVRYQAGSDAKTKGKILISNNKIKFVEENGNTLAILNLNTGEMIQVDNRGRRYVVAKPEDYVKFFGEATARMKTELEKQLAQLPPDQRAKIQQNMKAQGISFPGEDKPVKLDLKKTGAVESIAGFKSNKYEVYEDGKLSEEVWVSAELGLDKELDMKKMADYMTEIKKATKQSSGLDEQEKVFKTLYDSGFPTKTVSHAIGGQGSYIEEITKVSPGDVADGEFQAPAGYKKVTLTEMLSADITSSPQKK
ncbi:MAG: DUF4412 domain-containing protein [Deltaproteobacteria bacterium]